MIKLITRADDLGSSHSANLAIKNAVDIGFIKNVSVMAVCSFLDEAAYMLADRSDISFGLHATINAEWDNVRWAPLTRNQSIMDPEGFCFRDPAMFLSHLPVIDEVVEELDAQFDYLTRSGFKLRYLDAHMFFERYIPGLQQEMNRWSKNKGLKYFNELPYELFPFMDYQSSTPGLFEKTLKNMTSGQYAYIVHPALYSEEMLETGNAAVPGEVVAYRRQQDADFACSQMTMQSCQQYGVDSISIKDKF
ncbi:MAG TPA: hypothetical protein DCM45_02170 [Clostridiales bacterium]|nr:hypothetical protein [Clostridiales bacterium]